MSLFWRFLANFILLKGRLGSWHLSDEITQIVICQYLEILTKSIKVLVQWIENSCNDEFMFCSFEIFGSRLTLYLPPLFFFGLKADYFPFFNLIKLNNRFIDLVFLKPVIGFTIRYPKYRFSFNIPKKNPSDENHDKGASDSTDIMTRSIPLMKKNPKKSLKELHQQLLKKLDLNHLPSGLPEIFTSTSSKGSSLASESGKTEEVIANEQLRISDSSPMPMLESKSASPVKNSVNSTSKVQNETPESKLPEKGLYRCAVDGCRSSFNRINDLKSHISLNHNEMTEFPCSFCFEEFEVFDSMADHLKTHIKNVFKCSHCQIASDVKEDLLSHIATQHPGQPKKITIYVKILNNARQKKILTGTKSPDPTNESKTNCDQSQGDQKTEENVEARGAESDSAGSSGTGVAKGDSGSTNTDTAKSRTSRKSAKPVKWQKDPTEDDDVVYILPAEKSMNVKCSRCSFTCESDQKVNGHTAEGHVGPNVSGLFRCKVCKMSTNVKSFFQQHMAHHTGRHIIRYYICPYCKIDTNSMDTVEEHVGDKHPSEAFRFEVLQETIEYLQDLLECPICKGAFMWKAEFISHIQTIHRLDDLVVHITDRFGEACPRNACIPRSLFRNLLSGAPDFEDLPSEQIALSSDEEIDEMSGGRETAVVVEGGDWPSKLEKVSQATSICVQQSSTKDGERILQFHCETCNYTYRNVLYTSYDYEKYSAHKKAHGSDKPESLIKKLLTKSVTPTVLSDNNSDSDAGFEAHQSGSMSCSSLLNAISSSKGRASFQCHLCPFQCSKTVHFKRHLAIHARNETLKEGYKCGYCQFAHYRLNCVKFHLGKYHGNYPHKMIRIVDGIEIELGLDDDPGKVRKSPSGQPVLSTPCLRTASEKRPTVRYEESLVLNQPRISSMTARSSPAVRDSSIQDMSLTDFELQLPPSMIYPEPIKCPKCDFSNRVRINLIRHLKLHREECEEIEETMYASPTAAYLQESSELRRLMLEEVRQSPTATAIKSEPISSSTHKRSAILDEKPLLRSILCEKPVALKIEPEDDSDDDESVPSEDRDTTAVRPNVSKDFADFSFRISGTDQYQCKQCHFVHRYPSKVKRHFLYKHVNLAPYRCGHCSFEAVESGKVKRHSQQVHRNEPELIIKRDVFSSTRKDDSSAGNATGSGTVSSKDHDGVKIIEETISGDKGDGQGDRWLAQFVIKLDNNMQCCKLCGYQQEGALSLKRHVYTTHLKSYPFSCNYCGVALMEIHRVKRHIEKYHAGMPLVVVRRHFEDLPQDGSGASSSATKTSLAGVFVKMEPEEIDDEAPQLDFYPKTEPEDYSEADNWEVDDPYHATDDLIDDAMLSPTENALSFGMDGLESDELESYVGGSHRRLFKCVYCGIISKWNRRDIRLHIMHVHMRRRVYTCRHCSFGNSKSKAIVKSHCVKFHPFKPVSVRDDLSLFNSVVPIEDKNGIVTMAFSSPSGVPLLDLRDLDPDISKKPDAKSETQKLPSAQPSRQAKFDEGIADEESKVDSIHLKKRESQTDAPTSRKTEVQTVTTASDKRETSVGKGKHRSEYRCKLCGFLNQNISHVKYHLICYHMKLKPFSCPYCHLYIWKSQGVLKHIEKHHAGREKKICATVEEKSTYLFANIEKVSSASDKARKEAEGEKLAAAGAGCETSTPAPRVGFFRCELCGYQDARNDKTKYHIIKQHLKLRQFSCPHCHLYMWGRQQVVNHIEELHPGMEVSITRTFQEYEEYLKLNITKVCAPTDDGASNKQPYSTTSRIGKPEVASSSIATSALFTTSVLQLRCSKCSFVTDSEMSLSAHRRSHRMYQCFHCEFKHMLAAKVQIHCLAKHPNKLVKYRQCDTSFVEPLGGGSLLNSHVPVTPRPDCRNSVERKSQKQYHPCDECPAHFDTVNELERHVSTEHKGMFICNYCHIVMWNKSGMLDHLKISHPNDPPNFRQMKKEPNASVNHRKRKEPMSSSSDTDEQLPKKMPKLELSDAGKDDKSCEKSTSDLNQGGAGSDSFAMYKCRLCNYRSGKVTVMRHHVMSHLRYHPYLCPYCDLVRSVKSFPITKHVRSKHPDKESKFLYARNEETEQQVKNNYYRMRMVENTSVEDKEILEDESDEGEVKELPNSPPLESSPFQSLPRKVLYKCTFCSLKTHIRTDMKHHLMREIQYKPYRCMYCTYSEPCKWSMRKHFRTKHSGVEVEVEEIRDPDSDERVEKLLEKCTIILKHSFDSEMLDWKNIPGDQKPTPGPSSKPKTSAILNVPQKPSSFGTSLLKRPFKSSKLMPIKFHRCPHCAYTSSSLKLVRGHMVKHGPYRLQCGYCDYRGHYPSRIRKHMRRHHQTLPFKYTKVALPPKEHKTEEIPVVHLPRAQQKMQPKPSPGTVFLDGVPMDIPLIPDGKGWYRCLQCDYQSINREHYKMHVVIHRPPKWKCYYCDQKYPVIFRLRRHSNQKHPNLPIKWVEIETGQMCIDSLKPASATNRQVSSTRIVQRETARKSTSGANRLQVAMFRSSHKFSKTDRKRSHSPSLEHDITVVKKTPFVIGEPYSLVDSESETTDCEYDGSRSTVLRLCCHLCSFVTSEKSEFACHLETSHPEMNDSITIEVLPGNEDCELFALRRCGFCSFESYVAQEFDEHVQTHTKEVPLCCEYCKYASFSRRKVEEHVQDFHPNVEVQIQPLKEPYTMSSEITSRHWSVNLDAFVELEDFMKISDEEFESVLDGYEVSFQRPECRAL